jgi:hypothetical protein
MAKRKAQAPAEFDYAAVGGRRLYLGNGDDEGVWMFGWIPPAFRTPAQHAAEGKAEAEMPRFSPPPHPKGDPKQALLYEAWKHPDVVQANGFAFEGIRQVTGSCFPAATRVTAEYGGAVPIETLEVGRHVRTAEGNRGKVLEVMRRHHAGPLVGIGLGYGPSLWATPEHPVLMRSGVYTPIGELRLGDEVSYDGTDGWATIRDLDRKPFDGEVYNLEVEGDHSYVAEGVGVHNCVGAGGGNCWMTLASIEAVRLGDPEVPLVPFWPLPYGRSRYYMGDRGPGEGSLGGMFAKAAREDGVVPANAAGLPPFDRSDMACWGRAAEMKFSDGDNPDTMALLPTSRKHLVKTTAQCSSADDVRAALVNGYPCTAASMYAHDGGRVQSEPAVSLARKQGQWAHQMSVLAWWEHPKLGEIFFLMNQWGQGAHTKCPSGAPPGGVWITKADMGWICRDEVFAFSQFDGFPGAAKPIPWVF